MYVADLSPPSDPEDTVQLVSACEEYLCHFRPLVNNDIEDERDSSQPTSLTSHPDRSYILKVKALKTKDGFKYSEEMIILHRDVSVVESKSGIKFRKKRSFTHHLDSSLVSPDKIRRPHHILPRMHPTKQCSAA